jgi:anaerobic selenocysteine-containing dehydrogenase
LKEVSTYCRICEPQCALVAHVDEAKQEILKLVPDESHPVHKGFACHKGLSFIEVHHDPDRLNAPQRRLNAKSAGPQFESLTWEAALPTVAAAIERLRATHGDDALGMYIGNPSAFNSTGRDAARQFARAVNVRYSFGSGTQDCSNKFAASEAMFGTVNLQPIPDLKHTDYFLSIGCNPRISHMSFVHMTDPMAAIRNIVARGGQVRYVNPRDIESASPATGSVTQVKPDTDVYFLAALIQEIKTQRWQDDAWIDAHAESIDDLWAFVAEFGPDRVSGVVGVPADEIRSIARDFANANGASVHVSTGVNMGRQGTIAYWLVQMLSLITGNLGQRGGNIYSPGYFPAATVGKPQTDDPFFESPFGPIRRVAGSLPGNLLADHIEEGLIKGLICMSGNPLLSMAGEERLAKALASLEFLLVIDIYPNATSTFADFVLPATDWLERDDVNSVSLGFQPEPYVQLGEAAVTPQYERKPEWWVFAALQQAMGLPSLLDESEPEPMARIARQLARSDIDLDDLRRRPANTIVLPEPDPAAIFEIGVQRPNGKIDCMPRLIQDGIETCRGVFESLQHELPSQLKLITLRTNYMMNSWLHNVPSLKREHVLDNPLHIHPSDMERLNLDEGTQVIVESDFGRIVATLRSDRTLRAGVVAMTHGWGHRGNRRLSVAANHPGTNVNAILPTGPGSYDPLSNMSFMTGIPVAVRSAE